MKKTLIAVLALVCLLAAGAGLSLFVIGEPVDGQQLYCETSIQGEILAVRISAVESAVALRGWQVQREDADLYLRGRKVLVSPLFQEGSYETTLDVTQTDRVYLGGRIIWQREA